MEALEVDAMISIDFWKNRRVFVTGHTGFKGSWLSIWLQALGANVRGYSLPAPTTPALFHEAGVARGMESLHGDIRDGAALKAALVEFRPEIVIHMAAQPLVRMSYADPVGTYSINVIGTLNLLEAIRFSESVRSIVNVTTDKCYENREWVWGYRETDPMGGFDPYSSSKGCAELVTSAYRQSFFKEGSVGLASARAGNVIGGGDWALDRLVPDILRAFEAGRTLVLRNPRATRPWQHVLEPLSGYLLLAERLYNEGHTYAEAWNFGPNDRDVRPVEWIVDRLARGWGGEAAAWTVQRDDRLHEAQYLKLDCSKARQRLDWTPRWSLETALEHIVRWHRAWRSNGNARACCIADISDYTCSEDPL